ncbi:MAG: CHAD domain-containing protein [Methylococcaceae bacterium]
MSTIGLQATQSLAEAGRKVFVYHFNDFLKCEEGVLSGENTEDLHDMRVATRRMRATLRIFQHGFKPNAVKFLKRGLKETIYVLGSVRDLDVFIENLVIYQQEKHSDTPLELMPLLDYCQIQRDRARTKMLTYFDSESYKKFKSETARLLKKERQGKSLPISTKQRPIPYQIRHVAPVLIYSHYDAIRAYEPFLNNADIELLHQLRIAFKYFRYTLENLQELLGNEGTIVIEEIKQIQTYLGNLNDTQFASQFVEHFLKKETTATVKKSIPIRHYLNDKMAERDRFLVEFPNVWHQFNSTKLRHHLALAVAAL